MNLESRLIPGLLAVPINQLNGSTFDYLYRKAPCYAGLRTILKRCLDIVECVKHLTSIDDVLKSGDYNELEKFCTLVALPKSLRTLVNRQFYETPELLTEQHALKNHGKLIGAFEETISDVEANKCQLCHQLNTKIEMGVLSAKQLQNYGNNFTNIHISY